MVSVYLEINMTRIVVESSDIKSMGYDEDSKTLEVEFIKGGIYQYHGMLPALYDVFLAAPSKGGFLARVIKPFFAMEKMA